MSISHMMILGTIRGLESLSIPEPPTGPAVVGP